MSSRLLNSTLERSRSQFYDELGQMALAKASNMQYHASAPISVHALKTALGINYKSLAKVLESLSNNGYCEFSCAEEQLKDSVEDIMIEVTRAGEMETRRYQYRKAFSDF